jgi:RimJ/RimL family protein N-acetyltransferase
MGELHHPEPRLTDGIVTLRPWEDGDVEFVVSACRDERVSRYSPAIAFPYVEADARDWFASQEPMRLEGTALDLAITDAQSGAPLGAIALVNFSWRDSTAETGYWLAQEARGHG